MDWDPTLTFWLSDVGEAGWYKVDPAIDAEIKDRFGKTWASALAGELDDWRRDPRGSLALLILLDQFSRNMYRGTSRAYSADPAARRIACGALRAGHDRRVESPGRQFFYLPLMHSEYLSDQERCVRLLKMRMPNSPQLDHAIRHRAVIRKFGRFPSRNSAMGRTDSSAELAYRAAGGYMG